MREYKLELEIGGHIKFDYAHRASEALEETAHNLAQGMNEL